jgi:hypothetical protein
MTREEQFRIIEAARERLISWAHARGIPLARLEFLVPFVADDFSLSTWLFYDTDASAAALEADGTTATVRREFLAAVRTLGYPERWADEIDFSVDSHENVVRSYEGSYFYRLR